MSLSVPVHDLQVIMPVFNGASFLAETLDTVLAQSEPNWQLLIINDGSTDESLSIIKIYAARDERILWRSRENKGLVVTLNELVSWSTASLIARMDADDLNAPTRFEKQLAFLQRFPDVDMVGCWAELFGARNEVWRFRESDNHTKILSLFGRCCMLHASVIARREVFETVPFNPEYAHMEDFVFLSDIITKTDFKFGNVREVLYYYRQHEDSVVYKNEALRKERYRELQHQHLMALGLELSKKELQYFWQFIDGNKASESQLEQIAATLNKIRQQLASSLPDDYFEIPLRWRKYCMANAHKDMYSLCDTSQFSFLEK